MGEYRHTGHTLKRQKILDMELKQSGELYVVRAIHSPLIKINFMKTHRL